jgi:hypothetical protein
LPKKTPKSRVARSAFKGYNRAVQGSAYAIGQAVFIRTDTPDYAEETVPFQTLEEMVRICATPRENLTLDKIMIYSLVEGEPQALMLGFLSSSKGQQPGMPSFDQVG